MFDLGLDVAGAAIVAYWVAVALAVYVAKVWRRCAGAPRWVLDRLAAEADAAAWEAKWRDDA